MLMMTEQRILFSIQNIMTITRHQYLFKMIAQKANKVRLEVIPDGQMKKTWKTTTTRIRVKIVTLDASTGMKFIPFLFRWHIFHRILLSS